MAWKPQSVTISLNLHTEHRVEEERPDKGFNLELELPPVTGRIPSLRLKIIHGIQPRAGMVATRTRVTVP